jgi:hypothetical protein
LLLLPHAASPSASAAVMKMVMMLRCILVIRMRVGMWFNAMWFNEVRAGGRVCARR